MTRITPVASRSTRRTIRTTLTGVLAGSVLLATVACAGGDSATGPRNGNKNVAGLYALSTINKKPIPSLIYRGQYYYADINYTFADLSITVTGGELILQDNGQFHLAVDLMFAAEGDEERGTRKIDGQYQLKGDEITLTAGGSSVTGTLAKGYVWVSLNPGGTQTSQTYYFKYTP